MAFDFSRIRYRRPSNKASNNYLHDLVGFDTEAYTTGRPFLFCTSLGDVWGYGDIPHVFFSRRFRGANFVCYNLRYDSGAVLHHLPARVLDKLRRLTKVKHAGYAYRYYPHKFLRISKGKHSVTFWDIMQFFRASLDAAAHTYLGERKITMATKEFTPEIVAAHYKRIVRYCLRDAELTAKLAAYFLEQLARYDIKPSALYSQASVAFKYFKERAGIVDVWHFWCKHRGALACASHAYAGGKFDILKRGAFNGAAYDIDSAYPYEISRLKDIRDAGVINACAYLPKADYAFMFCHVKIPHGFAHPIPYRVGTLALYPIGEFDCCLTKTEYEYLIDAGIKVSIKSGYHIFCSRTGYPYKKVVEDLWKIKSDTKFHDDTFRGNAKLLLNGFYGKLVQLTAEPDKTLRAGSGWNPIYGAVITANCRVRISQYEQQLGGGALAILTDGLLASKPLPSASLGRGMGSLGLKREGDGVIVACGIYEHDGRCADRGFKLKEDFKWTKLLGEMGSRSTISLSERRVVSWLAAVHDGRPEEINLFKTMHKLFDVNCDRKRIWSQKATGASLLRGLESSSPRMIWR
jgi:hypothetical protein